MKHQILLTVSGAIASELPAQVAEGKRPRVDYLEMARSFGADLIDYTIARREGGLLGRLIERVAGSDMLLAWACFKRRRRYAAIFTDGEQIGLPLAAMLKYLAPGPRPRHLMIVHILSVPKKLFFLDRLRVQTHIDRFLTYASWQREFIERRAKLPPGRVIFTPFMVDDRFFRPDAVRPCERAEPQICAVGLERRDYKTLLKAAEGLPAHVTIAAASPWSKRSDSTAGQSIPENVTVRKFTQYELRQLYADSEFLVMPLEEVDFQAGVTAILEAMAMGKAVICTRTPGQTDVLVEGETGIYVPPGDPQALRAAIERLLQHPEEAERMGRNGRRVIEQQMNLDHYVAGLRSHIQAVLEGVGAGRSATEPA